LFVAESNNTIIDVPSSLNIADNTVGVGGSAVVLITVTALPLLPYTTEYSSAEGPVILAWIKYTSGEPATRVASYLDFSELLENEMVLG
jgi:hypothetical protein